MKEIRCYAYTSCDTNRYVKFLYVLKSAAKWPIYIQGAISGIEKEKNKTELKSPALSKKLNYIFLSIGQIQ